MGGKGYQVTFLHLKKLMCIGWYQTMPTGNTDEGQTEDCYGCLHSHICSYGLSSPPPPYRKAKGRETPTTTWLLVRPPPTERETTLHLAQHRKMKKRKRGREGGREEAAPKVTRGFRRKRSFMFLRNPQ